MFQTWLILCKLWNELLIKLPRCIWFLWRFCIEIFNVSVRGMLVKSDFISSEISNYKTSLANEKESLILYSLFVSGLSNWSQSLASLLVGAPFADEIGQNDDIPSFNALWILASAHRTPGLEPDGCKSGFSVSETWTWSYKLLRGMNLPYESTDSKFFLPQYSLY